MGYSEELKEAIEKGMKRVMVDIRLRNSPFRAWGDMEAV